MTANAKGPGKRIVVKIDGLHLIAGCIEPDEEVPVMISLPVQDDGPPRLVNLIKVRPRFAVFRELVLPPTSLFSDTFDPRQV